MAAWEMQAAMTAFHQVKTGLGTFPLRMKIGMHSGAVFAARVGDADGQEFIVTGPTVNATARAESLASAGQILISEEMYAQVEAMRPGFLTVAPGPEGHQVVMALGANSASRFVSPPGKSFPLPAGADLVLPDEPWPTSVRRILIALERLTPYLPTGLLPRLVPAPFRHETGGEHRLVVVLFANFVGASELIVKAGKARSGAIADALSAYFTTVQQIISRYGGVVNKVDLYDHGDKLMALFGAPIAYEDDVERAIRAALEMRTATQAPDFQERVGFLRSQRIGISSGVVFAGHVGSPHRREYTVMGDEVNLAARLMSAAQEGEILTSDYVHRKISTLFELVDRGAVQLKGKRLPVSTYAVVGERATSAAERGIHGLRSPLVSREKEMEALQKAVTRLWRRKEGRIISIISEAGLGKSRLAAELRTWSARFKDRIRWLEGRGLSYTQQVSYSVFIPIVQDALGITETDSVTDIWYKLRHRTAELLPKEVEEDILPYLAQFLSLPLSAQDAERVAYLEGEALQRQISRAITVFLEHLAYERPLVLVIDDLHWADSASLTLLERCLALAERAPLLLMLLYRPEKEHGCWALGETAPREHPHHYTAITLQPLEREENQDVRLVCNLLNLEALPPTLEQLIGRAEGNPFYVEEIIRMLIDQGTIVRQGERWQLVREIELETVPDTLQGLIMARLDRLLEEARRTLQLASVIGRIFRQHMLHWLAAAVDLASRMNVNLMTLRQAELVRQRAVLPEPEYAFKQMMIRDVTYESLLIRDRRVYHHLLAQNLEREYSTRLEEIYELLAHHYALSPDRQKALEYLLKAGRKAQTTYANPEAISFYRQAERLAQELGRQQEQGDALEGLGNVLFHVGEYDEALRCYRQALPLRTTLRERAEVYRRMGMVYEKRGEYERALEVCGEGIALLTPDEERSVEMARLLITRARVYQQQGQSAAALTDGQASLSIVLGTNHYREIAQAYNSLGLSYRDTQPDKAVEHLEQGLAILERIGDEYEAARVYGNLAILYYQTDLARSAMYFQRVLNTMQRLGDVWGESTTYQNLGIIHYAQGNYSQAIDYYHRSMSMKERIGDSLGVADCCINLGEVYRAQGDLSQAIAYLNRGLTIAQEIGANQAETECYRQLAECYLENNEVAVAMETCNAALAHAQRIGDRKEKGIIYRVLGKAYLQGGYADTSLAHLEHSLALLQELNQEFDVGLVLCDYAEALAEVGEKEQARERLEQALAIFERLQLPQEQARVQATLARLT